MAGPFHHHLDPLYFIRSSTQRRGFAASPVVSCSHFEGSSLIATSKPNPVSARRRSERRSANRSGAVAQPCVSKSRRMVSRPLPSSVMRTR